MDAGLASEWDELTLNALRCNRSPSLVEVAKRWGDKLAALYSEAHRRYHNLNHVRALLQLAHDDQAPVTDGRQVRLAIWFHDAIYNTGPEHAAGSNERESADLLLQFITELNQAAAAAKADGAGVSPEHAQQCHNWIVRTANHFGPHEPQRDSDGNVCTEAEANCQAFLDMDLAILGVAPEDYDRYTEQVREEYGYLTDEQFTHGRLRVVRSMAANSQLYGTEYFRARFEAPARANLKREIVGLEATAARMQQQQQQGGS